jgi:superfamily II DNA or RNA helicase
MSIKWYDDVANQSRDILEEIIKLLESWLALAKPFEVYLKTALLLTNSRKYHLVPTIHTPTYFQRGVVTRALDQLSEYGGALIVAATGLGKTVIGAEIALQMTHLGKLKRIILIVPYSISSNWKKEFIERDIGKVEMFSPEILFRRESNMWHHQVHQLEQLLSYANHTTLIMIDEAHAYRNQLLSSEAKKSKSRVYQRLKPAVQKGAKIVLLTATAYSTSVHNFKSLLHLLPDRSNTGFSLQGSWDISHPDDFSRLPVVTVLGLPHVLKMARNRGDLDEQGRAFIQLSDDRKYLPKSLKLYTINYELFLENELRTAFDKEYFDQSVKVLQTYFDDDTQATRKGTTDAAYNASLSSWLSSPKALIDSIKRNIATLGVDDTRTTKVQRQKINATAQGTFQPSLWEQDSSLKDSGEHKSTVYDSSYSKPMLLGIAKRKKLLVPILKTLEQLGKSDYKLMKLQEIIEEHCLQLSSKVIIFVGRRFTALYLTEKLLDVFGDRISVGCTIEQNEDKPRLKAPYTRVELLKQFSPLSHSFKTNKQLNVLICTDADSIGVNLQDANTIVNFDPPGGADVLFQRVGRVLRMTKDSERIIHIYTLIPSLENRFKSSRVQQKIGEIFERITQRHDKSRRVLGSSVISNEKQLEITLDGEVDVEQFSDNSLLQEVGGSGTESWLRHVSLLEKYFEQANSLPELLFSARSYSGKEFRLFVLIEYENNYHPILLNVAENKLEQKDALAILDMLECGSSEPQATANALEIEILAHRAVEIWCKERGFEVAQANKICTLLFVPFDKSNEPKNLFVHLKD